jgi:hypothetical protein
MFLLAIGCNQLHRRVLRKHLWTVDSFSVPTSQPNWNCQCAVGALALLPALDGLGDGGAAFRPFDDPEPAAPEPLVT